MLEAKLQATRTVAAAALGAMPLRQLRAGGRPHSKRAVFADRNSKACVIWDVLSTEIKKAALSGGLLSVWFQEPVILQSELNPDCSKHTVTQDNFSLMRADLPERLRR
jgi:hypothetical protein